MGTTENDQSTNESQRDDYATTDEALCDALDEEFRETIAQLAEARGQTTAGVVKAALKQLADSYEGRIIKFRHAEHARGYYKRHRTDALEFEGATEELTPPGYYEQPAQPVKVALERMRAEHEEKANAAARWLDKNDPETRVVTNEHGVPESIPQLDSELEVQHGVEDDGDGGDQGAQFA